MCEPEPAASTLSRFTNGLYDPSTCSCSRVIDPAIIEKGGTDHLFSYFIRLQIYRSSASVNSD